MESASGPDFADEIAERARQHEQDDPTYLARIRRSTRRLAASDDAPDDAWAALLAIEDSARIDVDVPTASRRRDATLLKLAVKRLTAWYLGYVGDQVTLLGQAMIRYGTAMVTRTDRLDETAAALRDDVAALTARVEHLERGTSAP
jgi:hypothetical protein